MRIADNAHRPASFLDAWEQINEKSLVGGG